MEIIIYQFILLLAGVVCIAAGLLLRPFFESLSEIDEQLNKNYLGTSGVKSKSYHHANTFLSKNIKVYSAILLILGIYFVIYFVKILVTQPLL